MIGEDWGEKMEKEATLLPLDMLKKSKQAANKNRKEYLDQDGRYQ
jgi:hypothetical protein